MAPCHVLSSSASILGATFLPVVATICGRSRANRSYSYTYPRPLIARLLGSGAHGQKHRGHRCIITGTTCTSLTHGAGCSSGGLRPTSPRRQRWPAWPSSQGLRTALGTSFRVKVGEARHTALRVVAPRHPWSLGASPTLHTDAASPSERGLLTEDIVSVTVAYGVWLWVQANAPRTKQATSSTACGVASSHSSCVVCAICLPAEQGCVRLSSLVQYLQLSCYTARHGGVCPSALQPLHSGNVKDHDNATAWDIQGGFATRLPPLLSTCRT